MKVKNVKHKFTLAILISLSLFTGCKALNSIFNPFSGEWESGIFNLTFESDKSFKLTVGNTFSINLQGNYKYDENTLTLYFDNNSSTVFDYEFDDDKTELYLKPQGNSKYFKTQITFKKK